MLGILARATRIFWDSMEGCKYFVLHKPMSFGAFLEQVWSGAVPHPTYFTSTLGLDLVEPPMVINSDLMLFF
jgi:hypothetical protein